MTKDQFTELVNLYLDGEISREELELLQQELEANPERNDEFQEQVRLERAMRMAFCAAKSEIAGHPQAEKSHSRIAQFPRWVFGSGLAAGLILTALIVPQISQQPTVENRLETSSNLAASEDPFDGLRPSHYNRYASSKEKTYHPHASLASHMRLLGLRPEYTPTEKKLHAVELSEFQPETQGLSQVELLTQIQELRTFPEIEIWAEEKPSYRASTSFGNGFNASLVSF